jgi:hypothetical protein
MKFGKQPAPVADIDEDKLEVHKPKTEAAGVKAVMVALERVVAQAGVTRTAQSRARPRGPRPLAPVHRRPRPHQPAAAKPDPRGGVVPPAGRRPRRLRSRPRIRRPGQYFYGCVPPTRVDRVCVTPRVGALFHPHQVCATARLSAEER